MAIDWTDLYKNHKGKWVALDKDETTVIASGATAKEALETARLRGYNNPILTRLPEDLVTYVGYGL